MYVLIPGLLLGYLVMGLIWPWSIMKFDNPSRRDLLLGILRKAVEGVVDGALVSVPDMPWSYLPTLFALKMPETMIVLFAIGAGAALVCARSPRRTGQSQDLLAMLRSPPHCR